MRPSLSSMLSVFETYLDYATELFVYPMQMVQRPN
jgi:hypothetical protein